jgi:putative membrane protein
MSLTRISLFAVAIMTSSAALAQPAGKPTDPQIAHIAYTAGQIDIQAAQLALKRSKNRDVKAFANDMVRDHKAVKRQGAGAGEEAQGQAPGQSHKPHARPTG